MFTPDASPARQALERRSATAVLWLHQLPRWLVIVPAAVLLFVGLTFHGPVAATALCVFAAMLGWAAALSWPRLPLPGRLIRVAVIGAVVAVAVVRGLQR